MKEKILMLLTMFSVICLSSFTSSKEMNHNTTTNAVKKSSPTVTVTYPSDFTRYLDIQFRRQKSKSNLGKYSALFAPYFWWDYLGTIGGESNPYNYVRDSDNWPDCSLTSGSLYCEIRANADALDESYPVPNSTIAVRYQY